jgi:hypothetical protein
VLLMFPFFADWATLCWNFWWAFVAVCICTAAVLEDVTHSFCFLGGYCAAQQLFSSRFHFPDTKYSSPHSTAVVA